MNRRSFLEMGAGLILGTASAAEKPSQTPSGGAHSGPEAKPRTGIAYDPLFLEHQLAPQHPESPQRLRVVMRGLEHNGLLETTAELKPLAGIEPHILRIHTAEHVASIKRRYKHSHEVATAAAAAGLAATAAVCKGELSNAFCAIRPPGHHARNTGREEGFCFYNTIAIAAAYARKVHGLERILIVDWDYHHGNGTEAAFYDDPSVLFFSTHDYHAYPGTGDPRKTGAGKGKGYNINVHLNCGANDKDILSAFNERLLPAAESFRPGLVLISAGFDSRREDTLGCFDVSDDGFTELTKMMTDLARRHCNGRLVSILEGGYHPPGLASAVVSHVNTLLEA